MPVLDFRKALKHREAHALRQHRPLLMLILLMGIMALAADSLRQPGLWAMLDRAASSAPEPSPDTADNRLAAAPRDTSFPDSFIMPPDRPEEQPAGQNGGYFPGVEPSELRTIRDNRPSLAEERPCSLHLLDILKQTDREVLRKASLGPVTYAQLFNQPANYRGRLVTLSGVVRRVERIEIPRNQYGIEAYYQVWLFPDDNPSAPMVVYCLDLPQGFPTGTDLTAQSGLTAFFFKLWAYSTPEADRVAPMLLAKTLRWWKQPVVTPEPAVDPRWLPMVVIVGALVAMFTAWYVSLWGPPPRGVLPDDRPPDFTQLSIEGESSEPSAAEETETPS